MSVEENKKTVLRFINEGLAKGDMSVLKQLLAPNYVNRLSGGGVDSFEHALGMIKTAIPDWQITIENVVAEGDEVMVRLNFKGTVTGSVMGSKPSGKSVAWRGITYYGLANGKIVEDDPIASGDVMQMLGISMPA